MGELAKWLEEQGLRSLIEVFEQHDVDFGVMIDLTDDVVNRVMKGQSESEVTALLGMPYGRVRFEKLKSTSLDYRYRDTWGYWVDLSVMMGDDGQVVGKVSRRIDPPDRD